MSEKEKLTAALISAAICGTDHPASAATVLMSAAASILVQQFGEEEASALMLGIVVTARAEWSLAHAN
ncbi:hypothetical protein J3E64_002681 [Sphingobium sp. OAS761]|uniref:hypothetical protein n=1 Tax=Sphingobium sp. OAS761 TaxID=2817901 RepID=UPI0020A1F685|nr:hypothetical protein [Sphingobium sp. OAS761]MCP1470984.1 hypothetical protein [Sphingobium sp. OAS761]